MPENPSPESQPSAPESTELEPRFARVVLGPPERPTPGPPYGVRLPAAARVVLYLVVWFVSMLFLQQMVVVFWVLLSGGPGAPGTALPANRLPPLPLLAGISIAEFAATIAVTLFFIRLIDGRSFRSLGFEQVRGWGRHWALGFGVEGLHFGLLFAVGLTAGWYQIISVAPVGQALLILLVATAIALPLAAAEEITMRGYVLQTLEGRYGTLAAVGVNSVIFAVLHLLNPEGARLMSFLGLVLAGIYLSVAYLATRQLWLPIAAHTAWNVYEGPVFGLPVSGVEMPYSILRTRVTGPELWTGGAFGPEAGLAALILLTIFTGVIWLAARKLLPEPTRT